LKSYIVSGIRQLIASYFATGRHLLLSMKGME
jgi:hypothetical protein